MGGTSKSTPAVTAAANAAPAVDHIAATPEKPDLSGWWGEDISFMLFAGFMCVLQGLGLGAIGWYYGLFS